MTYTSVATATAGVTVGLLRMGIVGDPKDLAAVGLITGSVLAVIAQLLWVDDELQRTRKEVAELDEKQTPPES
ncbi:hypothetical protein ACFY05_31900 [Microtetraspora fusca]|uniref:Holin n=1 Tax=Microtetraspora fusca TaxID=1997 RepID=A0ABW6VDQ4_MICFU